MWRKSWVADFPNSISVFVGEQDLEFPESNLSGLSKLIELEEFADANPGAFERLEFHKYGCGEDCEFYSLEEEDWIKSITVTYYSLELNGKLRDIV